MKRKLIFTLITLSLINLTGRAQPCGPMSPAPDNCNNCVLVNLPQSVTICSGSSYGFTPAISVPMGFTIKDFSWTGSVVVPSSGTGAPPFTTITPPPPATYPSCLVVPYLYNLTVNAWGPENVINGDFSAGASDFCSQYALGSAASLSTSQYDVCSDANVIPGWFTSSTAPPHFFDHTTGTAAGAMLVADGNANVNVVWQQKVNVCPGETYDLSVWKAVLHTSGSMADLSVTIADAAGVQMTYPLTTATGDYDTWRHFSYSWTNPTGASYTSATIYIHGGGSIPGSWSLLPWGSIFALDDISFRRVCTATGQMVVNVDYPDISGPDRVCVGSTISLIGCPGGTWVCTSGATIDALGNVTGVSPGTVTVTHTTSSGCTTTKMITVNPVPVITGPGTVCEGNHILWSSGGISGIWSSTPNLPPVTPSISSTKYFYGLSAGPAVITFTDPVTGCATSASVTVNPTPVILAPYHHVCIGYTASLPTTISGGTWTSSNTSVATIGSTTGTLTAIGAGTTTITYTLSTGCFATTTITVYDCAGGSGIVTQRVCQDQYAAFDLAAGIPSGGTWTSSDPSVATVDPITGVVYGVSGGTVTIIYTVGSSSWSITITVTGIPTFSVTTICCPYEFVFASTCPGTIFYYWVKDYSGTIIGWGWTYAGTVPLASLVSSFGPTVFSVCVYSITCNYCAWNVDQCAHVNPGPKPSTVGNETTGSSFTVYPNPNKGVFTVAGSLTGGNNLSEIQLEVVDMLGKTVYQTAAAVEKAKINKNISLDNIPAGVYLLRIVGQSTMHRVVIEK